MSVDQKEIEKAVEAHMASRKVVHAQRDAAQAVETAREAQITSAVATGIKEAFSTENGQKRYVDVSRVPLICQSIIAIHESLQEIKENMVVKDSFYPVRNLVYGMVGLVLTAVVGALMALIIKQ